MTAPSRGKGAINHVVPEFWDEGLNSFSAATAAGKNFFLEVVKGNVPKHSIVHKFGAGEIDTSVKPISQDGVYMTPTSAVALEVVSTSTNDTAAGTYAQQVTIIGLDENWNEVTQTVEMAGTTPVALGTNLLRLYRWYVSRVGTYCTQNSGSHEGTLTIQVSGAGAVWSTIIVTPLPTGQSQIGCYTVPTGYTAYLLSKNIFTDASKTADVYFFQRPNADDVTTPFTGTMRLIERQVGVVGGESIKSFAPKGPFVGPCDLGFLGIVAATSAECSVEFELLLVQD